MASVENNTFQDEAVAVDGNQYKRCVFQNTQLVYGGGTLPTFIDCKFMRVTLKFEGQAANTLNFLSSLQSGGFAPAVGKILEGIRGMKA